VSSSVNCIRPAQEDIARAAGQDWWPQPPKPHRCRPYSAEAHRTSWPPCPREKTARKTTARPWPVSAAVGPPATPLRPWGSTRKQLCLARPGSVGTGDLSITNRRVGGVSGPCCSSCSRAARPCRQGWALWSAFSDSYSGLQEVDLHWSIGRAKRSETDNDPALVAWKRATHARTWAELLGRSIGPGGRRGFLSI